MLKIDAHTHILPKKMPNWSEKFGYGDFIYLQHHKKGFAKMMRGNQFFREIKENCWNPDLRIKEYEEFYTGEEKLDLHSLFLARSEHLKFQL